MEVTSPECGLAMVGLARTSPVPPLPRELCLDVVKLVPSLNKAMQAHLHQSVVVAALVAGVFGLGSRVHCNTPGVYHQLSGGFKIKHDRLGEMTMSKSNLWE
jgi:hypothetical protein